jgi:hypothetical protein
MGCACKLGHLKKKIEDMLTRSIEETQRNKDNV